MKIPKKLYKPIFISILLIKILGFDQAQQILGFIASIICLPTSIVSLFGIMYVIDEEKIINKALIEARKKDQDEWEKIKKQMDAN